LQSLGYDCVIIPGAVKMTSPYTVLIPNQAFCGAGGLGLVDASATTTGGNTICCKYIILKFFFTPTVNPIKVT